MIKEYQPGGYYKIFPITGNRNAVVKFIPVNKNIYDYNGKLLGAVPIFIPIMAAITGAVTATVGTVGGIAGAVARRKDR